jgi:hypothetical protein
LSPAISETPKNISEEINKKVSSMSVDISHENLLTEINKYENCRPHHFITEVVYRNTNAKVIPIHAVKAHGGSRGIAPPILNLNNRCT